VLCAHAARAHLPEHLDLGPGRPRVRRAALPVQFVPGRQRRLPRPSSAEPQEVAEQQLLCRSARRRPLCWHPPASQARSSSIRSCRHRAAGPGGDLVEVALGVRLHEQLVELVGDAAAVLDGRDHVAHRLPGRPRRALGVHLQQVVLRAAARSATACRAPSLRVQSPAAGLCGSRQGAARVAAPAETWCRRPGRTG